MPAPRLLARATSRGYQPSLPAGADLTVRRPEGTLVTRGRPVGPEAAVPELGGFEAMAVT